MYRRSQRNKCSKRQKLAEASGQHKGQWDIFSLSLSNAMLIAFRFIINKYDVIIHLLLLLRQRKNPIPKILRGSDNDVSFF